MKCKKWNCWIEIFFRHHIFTYSVSAESSSQYKLILTQLCYAVTFNTEGNRLFCPCPCCWVEYIHWAFWSNGGGGSSNGVNFSLQVNHLEEISFCRHRRHFRPAVWIVFIAIILRSTQSISTRYPRNTTTHEDAWRRYRWWMWGQGNGIRWDDAS